MAKATKKQKLKPVVIKMSRWKRRIPETGAETFDQYGTCLYESTSRSMCCLGFDARQVCGKSIDDIKNVDLPSAVGIQDFTKINRKGLKAAGFGKKLDSYDGEDLAVNINDVPSDMGIETTAQQKAALKKIFKLAGRSLSFVP